MTECELAAKVIEWLERAHWDVYPEVQMRTGGNRADIVAVRSPITMVVETKRTLGFEVFDQALEWLPFAHYVAVATPLNRRRRHPRETLRMLADTTGIGILYVWEEFISWGLAPRLHRRIRKNIANCCCEGHKTHGKAGTNYGGYYTPYRGTIDSVKRILANGQPMRMKDLMDTLADRHHYASDQVARSCIPQALGKWETDTFDVQRDGRHLIVRLRQAAIAAEAAGGKA